MQLQSLTGLLNKHMDRKEFLRTLLIIAAAIVGLGFLVRGTSATPAATTGSATPAPRSSTDTYGA